MPMTPSPQNNSEKQLLGAINFAERQALIGFAGPRVTKETIKRDLPEGFQTSEFLLEHGFLDFIVDRSDLKEKISDLLYFFDENRVSQPANSNSASVAQENG